MVCHLVLQKLIEETVRNIVQSPIMDPALSVFFETGHFCVPFTSTFHPLTYAKHRVVICYQ